MYDVKEKTTTPIEKLEELSETILENVDNKLCDIQDGLDDRIGDLTFRQEDVESCIDNAQDDIITLNGEVVELRETVEDMQDTIQELQDKLEELTNEWLL